MGNELIEAPAISLIDIGSLPQSAQEIYEYVRDALVQRAEPLKKLSMSICDDIATLPDKWEEWTLEDCELASKLYDENAKHAKLVEAEFKEITQKAFKLHRGITGAATDVLVTLPADYKRLMTNIRLWRNREEERARKEAERLAEEARKAEEEKRLAEALRLEEEAAKLALANPQAAEEKKAEAEAVINENPAFVPPPVVPSAIPKGGPKRQKYMKFQVTDFAKLPDKYKIANDKMIQGVANAMKLKADIPGVEFWEE